MEHNGPNDARSTAADVWDIADESSTGALVVAVLLLVGSVWFVIHSLSLLPAARALPLTIGVPTVGLALANVVRQGVRTLRPTPGGNPAGRLLRRSDDSLPEPAAAAGSSRMVALFWPVAFWGAHLLLGFTYSSILFLLLFLRIYGKARWVLIVAVLAGMLLVFQVFFGMVIELRFYRGYIPRYLGI